MTQPTATIVPGRRYKIINAKSGTALDLSASNKKSVCGWAFHGRDNQIWEASEKDGFWYFKNMDDGKYLAIEAGDPRNGLKVIGAATRYGWHIWPDNKDPTALRILIPGTGTWNVDLTGYGKKEGGTPVEIWGRNNENTNQTWHFYEV